MNKRLLLSCVLFCVVSFLHAQDTLQIMQYNLLNYGNYYGDCSTSTNNVQDKNNYLRTIVEHVQPDIFTVNEISTNPQYAQMLLDNVLNVSGTKYRKASALGNGGYIMNMMYYNADKLVLYAQDQVACIVRPIDVYTLYYKSVDLAQTQDTVFLHCFVAHLKAGTGETNENKRASMVSSAMSYIRTHDLHDNMLFMGDLNLYSSNEQAYVNLMYTYNGKRYFYDPINKPGNWHSNYAFRQYHTQSTHAANLPCFSSGGLDDRFDFILASKELLEGSSHMQMLENTYYALGNDGKHFNKSIINPPANTNVPQNVLQALYNNSDHLPILVKIAVDKPVGIEETPSQIAYVRFANPVKGFLNLQIGTMSPQRLHIDIFDVYGKLVKQVPSFFVQAQITQLIDVSHLSLGTYVLSVKDAKGRSYSKKFVVMR